MKDVLVDILAHTIPLNILDTIKVTGSNTETLFESLAADTSIVFKANLKTPLPELNGIFGMSNLKILKGLTDFASFKTDNATVSIRNEIKDNVDTPVEIIFKDEDNRTAHYRLLPPSIVPNQPKPINSAWDITFIPTKSKIQELNKAAQIFSGQEEFFFVKTVGDELQIFIGEEGSSSHRMYVTFNKGSTGTVSGLHWNISQVIDVLKLITDSDITEMKIMNKGLLQISIENDVATYQFLLPAKKK